jgi:hypothetical protein
MSATLDPRGPHHPYLREPNAVEDGLSDPDLASAVHRVARVPRLLVACTYDAVLSLPAPTGPRPFGVNESEVTTRKGESDPEVTYPRIPGIEGVGVVDQADEDSGLRPGQQVATMMGGMGRSFDGSYAQYVTVPAGQVIPFETGLPWEVAGALQRSCSRRVWNTPHSYTLRKIR